MKVEIVATSELPRHAAMRLATLLHEAVETRGAASLALSGGSTSAPMLSELRDLSLPWDRIQVVQVDERLAPDGHAERNWTDISTHLLAHLPTAPAGSHPMPVVAAAQGGAAASDAVERYLDVLESVAGRPIVLDAVHLGLGSDGHTASLVPDDPVLEIDDRDVALTGVYQGRRRMTLTFPALARARRLVWLVSGSSKTAVVGKLVRGDSSIPAGRVRPHAATLLVDPDAASELF